MPNKNSRLLSPSELLDIYAIPSLNDIELQEYFTFVNSELKTLKSFSDLTDAVYFAVCLAFFKIKQTFIDFTYREITLERQHVIRRYFPNDISPKTLPSAHSIFRIKNKVLSLQGYQRFTGIIQDKIKRELQQSASHYPRQRQLCKALLNSFVKHRVSIPRYSTLQEIITEIWNKENNRIIKSYLRYTTIKQRKIVLSLLDKTDDLHHIISVRKDMKSFNTHDLWEEIEKHSQLKQIFDIAHAVLLQIGLPTTTIAYYSNLIHYYSAPGLKQINPDAAGLYLLCYTHTRYQKVNDNLLEAFKKRTLDYKKKATDYSKAQALKQLEIIQEIRENVSNLLIAIKYAPHPTYVLKKDLYDHVPEAELLRAASLLVDDNFNKDFLFWKYIDEAEDSIILNLRKLFLSIDFIVSNNEPLTKVVAYVKDNVAHGSLSNSLPFYVKEWVGKEAMGHIMSNNIVLYNRLEFFLYMKMVYHLGTNKITLQHSIKHKKVEDELFDRTKWDKEKKAILKNLDYPKLLSPIQNILNEKSDTLTALYKIVNDAIDKGENTFIKIKHNSKGDRVWRLSPLEGSDPNEGLFSNLQQRSIGDIIQFVNHKTKFCRVFTPILPRSTREEKNTELIIACILANAIRLGSRKMASVSDLNESSLITAEASYLRLETLLSAIDEINNAISKFPIYKEWYIGSILHGSLDGLKLKTSIKNIKARHSSKYFGDGIGVSVYNEIVNSLSIASRLIGSHEYEGNFTFEMVHYQNTSDIKPTHISTDKHGMNALNFALFDLTDLIFCPRIPKLHRETLWGFGNPKDYEGFLIKPTKFVEKNLIPEEWDNIQRLLASLLTGEAIPSVVIRKMASKDFSSKTKSALVQYNHIVKSHFILKYLNDPEFRRAIMHALNRGEHYNNLYRAISILNNGEIKGKTEIEMEIWNQCTRLISSVIHYYNAYVLNNFYVSSTNEDEKQFLASLSPTAWVHVNLLGHYQFYAPTDHNWIDILLNQWDWKSNANFVEKN